MDHRYEFMIAYQEQVLDWARNNRRLNRIRGREKDLRSRIFLILGNGFISLGNWVKQLSLSAVDKPGYSQSR